MAHVNSSIGLECQYFGARWYQKGTVVRAKSIDRQAYFLLRHSSLGDQLPKQQWPADHAALLVHLAKRAKYLFDNEFQAGETAKNLIGVLRQRARHTPYFFIVLNSQMTDCSI